jgi:hypothetical protein
MSRAQPTRCQAVDALGVAAMDQHHVRTRSRTLSSVAQTLLAKVSASSSVAWRVRPPAKTTGMPSGMAARRLASARARRKSRPSTSAEVSMAPWIEARAGDRLPGRTELVEVEGGGDLAHLFERQHGALGALRPLDLGFEFMGVDLRSIGGGDECADLVGGAVKGVDLRCAERWKMLTKAQPRSSASASSAVPDTMAKRSDQTASSVWTTARGLGNRYW